MPFVTRWVVVCESVRRSLVRDLGLRADAIGLVPNGVDTAVFAPPADRRQHRMQRGYTDADIVIGTVGRAVPVKNWPVLLQAFARVRRRHPGAHLVLVGDGPDKAASEAVVRALDIGTAVRFVGHSNDVPAWLACMDVFALPSSTEAASNALLEAMAVGLPAVATDAGGTPELVDAGVTGQLVPPTDVAALAETLAAYCEDGPLRLAHGAAGRRRVEQRFSMHAMASGYTDVYRRALRARSVSRSESSSASVSANGKG